MLVFLPAFLTVAILIVGEVVFSFHILLSAQLRQRQGADVEDRSILPSGAMTLSFVKNDGRDFLLLNGGIFRFSNKLCNRGG